jgi:hypothetical protein
MSRLGVEIQDHAALEEEGRDSALRAALLERKAREQRINRATNRVLAFTLTVSIVSVWVAIRFH